MRPGGFVRRGALHKLGFIVLMKSAQPGNDYHVIARSEATWQSPGDIHRPAPQKQTSYREIAMSGYALLAMTQNSVNFVCADFISTINSNLQSVLSWVALGQKV